MGTASFFRRLFDDLYPANQEGRGGIIGDVRRRLPGLLPGTPKYFPRLYNLPEFLTRRR